MLLGVFLASSGFAQIRQIRVPAPAEMEQGREYHGVADEALAGDGYVMVRPGDSLRMIAWRELGAESRWPELLAANPAYRAGRLFAGDLLRRPLASRSRGAGPWYHPSEVPLPAAAGREDRMRYVLALALERQALEARNEREREAIAGLDAQIASCRADLARLNREIDRLKHLSDEELFHIEMERIRIRQEAKYGDLREYYERRLQEHRAKGREPNIITLDPKP